MLLYSFKIKRKKKHKNQLKSYKIIYHSKKMKKGRNNLQERDHAYIFYEEREKIGNCFLQANFQKASNFLVVQK